MAVAGLAQELPAQGGRPGATRHGGEAASLIEGRIPRYAEIGREIECVVPELARSSRGAIDQCSAETVPLPAVQHRKLVEPRRAARKLHQSETHDAVERR